MATVYGINRTLKNTGAVNTIEPEINGSNVEWLYEEYEASALVGTSIIELFGKDLPAEARIVDWIIDHDALATGSLKIKFGTNEDDDEFMVFTDCYAVDKKNFTDDGVSASLGFEINSGTGQVLILTTSGSSAATGTIKVAVAYVAK